MLSIQAVRGLPRLRESGIVPCIISSSWCDHSMLASLLWRCRTVPSLSQLCYEPTHLFSLLSIQPTESFLVLSSQRRQDEFLHSSGRPEYTIVWLSSVVKCPCPSHLNDLTSDNPHISTPNLTISSLSSWTLPSCCILRIFQAPSLLHSCSCLSPCGNILVFFIMVNPVTNFSTLPWLLDGGHRPCLAGWRPSQNVFLCACIVHSVAPGDKVVGSQVFPSCSREALFQLH